jgi:hypothetical protein
MPTSIAVSILPKLMPHSKFQRRSATIIIMKPILVFPAPQALETPKSVF